MPGVDIVLHGNNSDYEVLYGVIASFAERERYSISFTEALQLTMKEAFVNAVKHGNHEQKDLTVSFRLIAGDKSLLVSVRDCGTGFDLDALPDPVDSGNLFNFSGRGVYIIRSIAETVALERDCDGSTLWLRYIPY